MHALHDVPTDATLRRDLLEGQDAGEAGNLLREASRHALVLIEPRDAGDRGTAARTGDARMRKHDPPLCFEHRQVAYVPLRVVMHLEDGLAAATTAPRVLGLDRK